MSMNQSAQSMYTDRLARLVQLSRDRHVFSFTRFDWVDDISEQDWWVSPELLTIHGTAY